MADLGPSIVNLHCYLVTGRRGERRQDVPIFYVPIRKFRLQGAYQ